jgi:phosphosulfolactate phosphohydrolase-like enzyme
VYNLSPHSHTKSTPLLLSEKFIKDNPKGSSLILETASGTLALSEVSFFITVMSF